MFTLGPPSEGPIDVLLVVMKTGRDCCELHLKTTEEDKQEATVSVAAAKEARMDAAAEAVFIRVGQQNKRKTKNGTVSPLAPMRSLELLLPGSRKCDWSAYKACPITMIIFFQTSLGFFPRWICKVNPAVMGNIPSGTSGYTIATIHRHTETTRG